MTPGTTWKLPTGSIIRVEGKVQTIGRRMKFLARLVYWACRHRSLSRGLWVAEYEGYSWN